MTIRSSVRRKTILGMVGTTLIGCGLFALEALALPTEQILQKLNPVPVFTIADDTGTPLVATGENGAKTAGVFISQQDANNFVTELKIKNPSLAGKVEVVPVSLGEVFKLSRNSSNNNRLNFAYVPNDLAVRDAKTCETYEGGVPLFVAKGGQDNGYLTIERDGQQVIPFFFKKSQLDNTIAKFNAQKPDLATTVSIEVIPLEGVIQALQTDNDPMLSKIVLVPSTESLQFLQQNSANTEIDRNTSKTEVEENVMQTDYGSYLEDAKQRVNAKEQIKNNSKVKGNIKCNSSNTSTNNTNRTNSEAIEEDLRQIREASRAGIEAMKIQQECIPICW